MYIFHCCIKCTHLFNCLQPKINEILLKEVQSLQVFHFLYVTDQLLWQPKLWNQIRTAMQDVAEAFIGAGVAVSWSRAELFLLVWITQVHLFCSPAAVWFFTSLFPTAAQIWLVHLQILHVLRHRAHTGRRILQGLLDAIHDCVFILWNLLQKLSHRGWDWAFRMFDLVPARYGTVTRHKEAARSHIMAQWKRAFNNSLSKRGSWCFR